MRKLILSSTAFVVIIGLLIFEQPVFAKDGLSEAQVQSFYKMVKRIKKIDDIEQVEQIKLSLEDTVPAYFVIKLGYLSAGVFVMYANGQMG